MAFSTYAELKSAVADWMHRKSLEGTAPALIKLGESRIKAKLRSQLQDVTATLPTVAGQPDVALPDDFLSVLTLSIPGVSPVVEYVTPEQYGRDASAGISGDPRTYTLIGGQLWLSPAPSAAKPLWLTYRASFPELSDTAPTNVLLTKWPDLYLWATLAEACIYSQNPEFLTVCEARFGEALNAITNNEWNSPGLLRVRSDAKVY
jgi:hypothetical protein